MPLKKIFFSYSRVDGAAFALKLALDLKKQGFNVWIDQQDIRAGTEWDLEIEKALETCDCLLFIETEKSVVSNNVLDEVYYAIEQRKKVIPVIYHDSKTPFRLQRLQHVDFTKSYEAGLANLVKELSSSDNATPFKTDGDGTAPDEESSFTKPSRLLLLLGIFAVIIAISFWYVKQRKQKQQQNAVQEIPENLNTIFTGNWRLIAVEPETRSYNGFLKIEAVDEKNVSIKSTLQFYYLKTNDTAYLNVFNGFTGCTNCILQKEMKLTTEDVAVGTQIYSILKQDKKGEGKAGDTVLDVGANKTIYATSLLLLKDSTTAIIKVRSNAPAPLDYGMTMPPFEYTFTFKKVE